MHEAPDRDPASHRRLELSSRPAAVGVGVASNGHREVFIQGRVKGVQITEETQGRTDAALGSGSAIIVCNCQVRSFGTQPIDRGISPYPRKEEEVVAWPPGRWNPKKGGLFSCFC